VTSRRAGRGCRESVEARCATRCGVVAVVDEKGEKTERPN